MWNIIHSEYVYSSTWLTVRKDKVKTGRDVIIDDFYVLEYPTWINVIAITADGRFIIEEQYRHGIAKTVFELCAGTCEKNETPLEAAKRELREETGYGDGDWHLLGKYAPNPNSMNNWCYTYVANGVRLIDTPHPELTEDICVHQFNRAEIKDLMQSGIIVEGVMLAALWQFLYQSDNNNQ